MKVKVELAAGARGWLTDERAESSYGQPVLVVEDEEDVALGPGDYSGVVVAENPTPEEIAWLTDIPTAGVLGWRIAIRETSV